MRNNYTIFSNFGFISGGQMIAVFTQSNTKYLISNFVFPSARSLFELELPGLNPDNRTENAPD